MKLFNKDGGNHAALVEKNGNLALGNLARSGAMTTAKPTTEVLLGLLIVEVQALRAELASTRSPEVHSV